MKVNAYKKNGETLYRFVAYIGIDPITGKQKQVRRSGFRTKREASLAFAKITAQGDTRQLEKKKLYEVCDIWLSYYVSTVEGSTYQKTERQVEQHIKPFFGDVDMSKVTPIKAQEFTNHIYGELVNGSTVVSLAKRIFNYAKSPLKAISEKPFDDVLRPPKKEKDIEDISYYTKEELLTFLDVAKTSLSPMWYLFFFLMAHTGLRRGEELALTWEDIDFKNRSVNINKALTRDKDGKAIVGKTKNKASKRIVEIDPITTYKLKQWWYKNKHQKYVFPNTKNSFITFSQPWNQLNKLKIQDIKIISPHGFRHTHCSMLFSAGVPLHLVQARLGHSDIKTTMNIYNHIYKSDEKEAVNKFTKYIRTRD